MNLIRFKLVTSDEFVANSAIILDASKLVECVVTGATCVTTFEAGSANSILTTTFDGDDAAEKLLNAKVAKEFTYSTYHNDYINALQMCDNGGFFTMGGFNNLESEHFKRAINILDIDIDPKKQEPMTFDKITKIYESLKRELYKDRLKAKIETVNKLQRKAGWIYNGREFNNTPQDSKQVPLSFDSI